MVKWAYVAIRGQQSCHVPRGESEVRWKTDEAAKYKALLQVQCGLRIHHQLSPVLCVGVEGLTSYKVCLKRSFVPQQDAHSRDSEYFE